MRQPFDQLAKRILRAVYALAGAVVNQHEVAPDALAIDTWFQPDPARAAERARMGLLGRMGEPASTMFEAFHGAPGVPEYRGAVFKQLALDRVSMLDAKKADRPALPFPWLWILCARRPDGVLDAYGFAEKPGWPAGFHERAQGDMLAICVLRELPRERDTLLLRLLGAGVVLQGAIEDLSALPDDAWERQLALPLLVALRFEIPQDPLDEDDREFLMTTAELYEHWKQHYKNEGVKQGVEQGVEQGVKKSLRKAYVARFGPLPAEVAAAIDGTHDAAVLDGWLDLVLSNTATAADLARALRAPAS
jgi:hypothetical protein